MRYILYFLIIGIITSCSTTRLSNSKIKERKKLETQIAKDYSKDYAKIIIKYDLLGLSRKRCIISDLYSDVYNSKVSVFHYKKKINSAYYKYKNLNNNINRNLHIRLKILAERYNKLANILNLPSKKFNPKPGSTSKLLQVAKKFHSQFRSVPIIHPVKKYSVTSNFGYRTHPILKRKRYHNGIDLISKFNHNLIYATNEGKVTFAGKQGGYGNVIKIDHGNGVSTLYAHLSKMYVKKGAFVEAGHEIGVMGKTGRVTNTHLHYEILINNRPIDPKIFIKLNNCNLK